MSVNVLLTTYASNPGIAGGGPVWRVVHLLKAVGNGAANGHRFAAVFVDTVLRSADDLAACDASDRKTAGLPLIRYAWPTARYALRLRKTAGSLRRGGQPLIVDAHDVLAAYLSRRLLPGTPQVLTIHTIGDWVSAGFLQLRPHLRGAPAERFFRHVEKDAVRHADVIVFPSAGAQRLFADAYPGVLNGQDVRIINAGLDIDAIDSAPADRSALEPYGIGGRRLLLCVAAHVREKGLDVIIDAVAALPPALREGTAVVIAGRGPLTSELRSRAQARGVKSMVHFIDRVPDVIGLMKAADVFLLPSRAAVFDVVLLEAMAARLPVITTNVGGNPEMFGDDAAVLVPPEEPLAVRDAIIRLLDDAALRSSLADAAYHRLQQRFTLTRMLEGYISVYESLTEGAAQRAPVRG